MINCQITFKNGFTLIACVIKNNGKFYPQIFLEEALPLKTKYCFCLKDRQHIEVLKSRFRTGERWV